jgi:hypothetical protein
MLHIYAAMAEAEGIAISTRTKAALAATAFSSDFDVARPQLGFPYQDGTSPVQWVPLRATVEKCITYWRSRLP